MATVIKPPNKFSIFDNFGKTVIFLAGSIEQGTAPDWQKSVEDSFAKDELITILNPRRDSWDPSWVQSINNAEFKAQVIWELRGIEEATIVAFWFEPGTLSPISLLELGLAASSFSEGNNHVIVGCPEGFWRKGNVDIICERYKIPLVGSIEELISAIKGYLE